MNKSRMLEIRESKTYQEELFIGKTSQKEKLMTTCWGICTILIGSEVKEQFEENECFSKCEDIQISAYNFYVDMESLEYFASPKGVSIC